jgi:3-oxoacyl-[acyl-carrier-protein] synthase-3
MTPTRPTKLRRITGAPNGRILGVGAYRPARVVPNSEIVDQLESSDEWIQSRSGIKSRRWAGEGESVVDMSVAAAGKALAAAGMSPDQIDCTIIATVSHPLQTPAAAAIVSDRLGTRGAAMDISAACAGFCYGVALGNDIIRGGSAEHVLVVGVERLSDFTDPYDRSIAFIFADGAGAAVLGPSAEPAIGPVVWGSDGSQAHLIEQRPSWLEVRDSDEKIWPSLRMEGQPVFRWAVYEMAKVAQRALEAAGIEAADLDVFIPHQANIRIVDAMARALKLPPHVRIARDVVDSGNTSAASVPLALDRMLEAGEATTGDTALIIGFGAGLVYAAQVVTLP